MVFWWVYLTKLQCPIIQSSNHLVADVIQVQNQLTLSKYIGWAWFHLLKGLSEQRWGLDKEETQLVDSIFSSRVLACLFWQSICRFGNCLPSPRLHTPISLQYMSWHTSLTAVLSLIEHFLIQGMQITMLILLYKASISAPHFQWQRTCYSCILEKKFPKTMDSLKINLLKNISESFVLTGVENQIFKYFKQNILIFCNQEAITKESVL